MKTGSSDTAGFNYSSTAKRGDTRLVEIVMGVSDWSDQTGEELRHLVGNAIMEQAFESLRLSARGYYRIIRVARTIADLEGSKEIRTPHLLEAVGYRTMDHNIWEEPFG